jgi:arginine N-succinyltransferase
LLSLWPKGEILVSLLPPEARALIGRVGEETEPAKRMLEKQGFKYHGHVDPFDGGPYLEAEVAEIPLVKSTVSLRVTEVLGSKGTHESALEAFVSYRAPEKGRGGFRATRTHYALTEGGVALPSATLEALSASVGTTVGFTPLPEAKPKQRRTKKA